jgi:cell wall-associated NlpC family hydrolase
MAAAAPGAPQAGAVVSRQEGNLPPLAATSDPLSQAAGEALWALRYGDPLYPVLLDDVARFVAERGGVNPTVVAHVWANTDAVRMTALLAALTQIGVRYRRYMAKEGVGFDCSGLTSWAWSKAGVTLVRSSWRQITWSKPVNAELARPGDLIYYPGHVMLSIGVGNAIVHAPFPGSVVEVRSLPIRRVGRVRAGSPI